CARWSRWERATSSGYLGSRCRWGCTWRERLFGRSDTVRCVTRYIHGETDPVEISRLETQARSLSRWILDGVEIGPGSFVLDLACGTGAMSRRLRARFPAVELFGCDISHDQLVAARAEQQRVRDHLPLVRRTAAALPLFPEAVDP